MHYSVEDLVSHYPDLEACRAELAAGADSVVRSIRSGGRLFLFGNGGSASDAEHIVGELVKPFLLERALSGEVRDRLAEYDRQFGTGLADGLRGGISAFSFTGPSSIVSAIGNDMGADLVYAQQVVAHCRPSDTVVAISTSGKSRNVVSAALAAKAIGSSVISFTGMPGEPLSGIANHPIRVNATRTDRVQELHVVCYHWFCARIESSLFGEGSHDVDTH